MISLPNEHGTAAVANAERRFAWGDLGFAADADLRWLTGSDVGPLDYTTSQIRRVFAHLAQDLTEATLFLTTHAMGALPTAAAQ